MTPRAEISTSLQETDSVVEESSERSVALIGPNAASRAIVAHALQGSDAGFVREFTAYPSKLTEVPRILEQGFNVVMIDVDSDESYALALVAALAAQSSVTVMVYSSRNQADLVMRCMQAGARDFLPLPAETPAVQAPAPAAPRREAIHVVEPKRAPQEIAPPPSAPPVPTPRPQPAVSQPQASTVAQSIRRPEPQPAPQPARQSVSAQPAQQPVRQSVTAPPASQPTRQSAPAQPAQQPVRQSVAAQPARQSAMPAPVQEPVRVAPPRAVAEPEMRRQAAAATLTFGQPTADETAPKNRTMMWILLMVLAVVGGAAVASIYWRSVRHVDSAPVSTPQVTQPAEPSATAGTVPVATPGTATGAVVAKPVAGEPVARTDVPERPRGITPDAMNAQLSAPSRIGNDVKNATPQEQAPPSGFAPGALESGGGSMPGVFTRSNKVQVMPGSAAISAGVAAGMLIHRTEPAYPKIAQDARVSGTVVIAATITKTGALSELHVVSGPPMLVGAALEAARTWRYRPYLLDNQPVEVQTTISIVFSMGR